MLSRYIALWGLSAHALWVIAICWNPIAMYATPLATLADFFNYSRPALVFSLVTSAIAVLVAMSPATSARPNYVNLALLIPQQFFMLLSAGGSILAIYNGHYADGVARSSAFILADQSPWILAAFLYTFSIVESFGRRAWNLTG